MSLSFALFYLIGGLFHIISFVFCYFMSVYCIYFGFATFDSVVLLIMVLVIFCFLYVSFLFSFFIFRLLHIAWLSFVYYIMFYVSLCCLSYVF